MWENCLGWGENPHIRIGCRITVGVRIIDDTLLKSPNDTLPSSSTVTIRFWSTCGWSALNPTVCSRAGGAKRLVLLQRSVTPQIK